MRESVKAYELYDPIAGTGRQARDHRDLFVELALRVGDAVPDAAQASVGEIADAVIGRPLRVALAGRTGIGLQRFANALACRPGLLPETCAPKSAIEMAVTFAQRRKRDPELAGQVHYFSKADWDALRADRAASLLEGLVPTPKGARLMRQVEEMRSRAYMRLGDQFHELTGTSARFDPLCEADRASLLGSSTQAATKTETCRFVDMVRRVEFDVPLGPFALPTEIVCTPGFDDSFPLAGLRSLQTLENADIVVLGLCADRPLTPEDRGLIERTVRRWPNRTMILLIRGEQPAARVDHAFLEKAVRRIAAENAGAACPPVALADLRAAEAASALAPAHPDRTPMLEGSGFTDAVAVLGEMIFWGPGARTNLEASEAAMVLAEEEVARLESLQARAKRSAARAGVEQTQARRDELAAVDDELDCLVSEARDRVEAAISVLWAEAREDATKALRLAALQPCGGSTMVSRTASGALEARVAAFPAHAREAVEDALRTHADKIGALVAEAHEGMRRLLAQTDVAERADVAVPIGAELDLDLSDALAALDAATPPSLATARGARLEREPSASDLQKRLVAPMFAPLEETVERATLAVGKAARASLDACHARAREDLAAEAGDGAHAMDPTEIESDLAELKAAASRLRAYADATRRMAG